MRRGKRKKWKLALLLSGMGLLGLLVLLRLRLFPIVEEMARMRVDSACTTRINDAINQQIAVGEIDYNMLVSLEKDVNGNVAALKTNMSEVNRLKTEILDLINNEIVEQTTEDLGIPLGNLLVPELFSGKGPLLPVQIVSVSSSDARFMNRFSEAGINQTLHQIVIEVILAATALTPVGTTTVEVSSQVVVAETVIVGTVPNSYINVNRQEAETK